MSSQTHRKHEESSSVNSLYPPDNAHSLTTKIEQLHTRNLQNLVSSLSQIMLELLRTLQTYEIQVTDKVVSNKMIVILKQNNNELKYHHKIAVNQDSTLHTTLSDDLDAVIQMLTKLKIKQNDTLLPKVRKNQDPHAAGYASPLSTITQKESEQNLIHNYLRKGSQRKHSKSNINKNLILNNSSIQDLQFEVIRQQTRKSLDNPYHRNNQTRKNLYNELQRTKGTDSLLPAVKNYLQKHRKASDIKSKLVQYQIQKLI